MIYSDRVTIFEYVEELDALNTIKRTRVPNVVPCARGRLAYEKQMGIFGTYDSKVVALHLQGIHENIDEVEYRGLPRQVRATFEHKHATVVVL